MPAVEVIADYFADPDALLAAVARALREELGRRCPDAAAFLATAAWRYGHDGYQHRWRLTVDPARWAAWEGALRAAAAELLRRREAPDGGLPAAVEILLHGPGDGGR